MFKKLIVGGLIVILIGVGAVAAYDLLRGDPALAYQAEPGRPAQRAAAGDERGYQGSTAGELSRNTGAYRETRLAQPQAAVSEWITLSGVIESVDGTTITVATATGEEMVIQLGPVQFWRNQDMILEPGLEVEVTAFDEGASLTAASLLLTATGERITVRDSNGRPLWTGNAGPGRDANGETSAVPGLADGPQPQAAVTEWVTVRGTVTAVELNALSLETADGEMMAVQLGPEHFWTTLGVALAAGDQVEVIGFYEDESSFSAGTVTLLATGEILTLRDDDGRPLWAGGPGAGSRGRGTRQVSG